MKIQNIKKSILVILTMCLMLLYVLAFAGCRDKKDETPPEGITIEQAKAIVNTAIIKANSATNIYREESEGVFTYADTNVYFSQWFNYSTMQGVTTKITKKQWYIYENSTWKTVSYSYDENGEICGRGNGNFYSSATTYLELLCEDLEFIPSYFDYEDIVVSVTKESENKTIINFKFGEDFFNVEIVNGYITKTTENYIMLDGIERIYEYSYSYNIEGKEIPQLPNEE